MEVELITSDIIEDFHGNYEKNIHKLVLQHREIDQTAVESIRKWKQITKILSLINLGFILLFIGLIYFLNDLRAILILIPIIALSVAVLIYKGEIKTKRIYSYWYSKLFPFKVFISTEANLSHSTFIHGKIYLIDDKIAYLGSLNFTKSGTEWNYETRVRTIDPNAIKLIKDEFYDLMENPEIPERDIQSWGRKLYKEPLN
ncbi:MAG: phospholipase D family protein [Muricauda sp.]|nr:phospholipase D family protein [Allomuricauda sp.]